MKVLAVIPAYQMSDYIRVVLVKCKSVIDDILLVDDGSTDETANAAIMEGITVLSHQYNKGKGAALKSGFAYAIEYDYDAVITLDGDGQHDPKYIPELINEYRKSRADLIIGSRVHDKADMPRDRKISNFLTSGFLSLLLKRHIEDSQCGFRFITTRLLKSITLKSERFELETELIIKAANQGFEIRFIPIRVLYGANFPTAMNRFMDTIRWLIMVLEEL